MSRCTMIIQMSILQKSICYPQEASTKKNIINSISLQEHFIRVSNTSLLSLGRVKVKRISSSLQRSIAFISPNQMTEDQGLTSVSLLQKMCIQRRRWNSNSNITLSLTIWFRKKPKYLCFQISILHFKKSKEINNQNTCGFLTKVMM